MAKLTAREELEYLELLEEEYKDTARKSHLAYMHYCWQKKSEPLIDGFHTERIAGAIDNAFKKLKKGQSSYLLINVHYRAGKTDLVSRYLSPHFLGEFPDYEVIQTSYKTDLSHKFTSFARNVFRSKEHQELYPDVKLSKESNAKGYWELVDDDGYPLQGKLFGSSLLGVTGSGGHLIIVDDYMSGRASAESKVQRDSTWDAFKDDVMTRQAPNCIVVVLATQWHWDDVTGRILEEMKNNKEFPQFERLVFPARAKDYKGEGEYPNEFLFEERYPKQWYLSQYATLGKYGSKALLDCNPERRTSGLLEMDNIVWHDVDDEEIPSVTQEQWARVWDLAHTAKQRQGDDPDWTSGTLLCFEIRDDDEVPHLWVKNVYRTREGSVERDKQIKLIARRDGTRVKQAVEKSIDSRDAFNYLAEAIPNVSWREIPITGDKTVRATPLEAIFEAEDHVHVIRGGWNDDWFDELSVFDGLGQDHDDMVDNLSAGYIMLIEKKATKRKQKALNSW